VTGLSDGVAERLRDTLLGVVHTVSGWLSRPIWEPEAGAAAASDIQATSGLLTTSQALWGEGPIRTAFVVARLMCQAALNHAEAAANLLSASHKSVLPVDTLTCGALEAASQAWWLLDPDIPGRTRVVRCFLLRHVDATEFAGVADKLKMLDPISEYGQTADQVASYYVTQLGLPDITGKGDRRDPFRCDGEKLPTHSVLVAQFMTSILDVNEQGVAKGFYAYFCGAPHAQLWRLMSHGPAIGTDGQAVLTPQVEREPVRAAVRSLIDACLQPAMRAITLFGWNDDLYNECDELINRTNTAMDVAP
jgi:hypothetical protein